MRYLLLVLIFVCLFACRKEEDPYVGKLQAKLNNGFGLVGMEARAFTEGEDTISIMGGITEDGILRWDIQFYKVPKKIGRFAFPTWEYTSPSITLTQWLSDGDAVGKMFLLPTSKPTNYIEITAYDPATGDIEGRFEFTAYSSYINERYETAFNLQDSMLFTNGEFYTRIRP